MRKTVNFLILSAISFTLLFASINIFSETAYGQCADGKILVKKTNKKGKVNFICVNENAVSGISNGENLMGEWRAREILFDYHNDEVINQAIYPEYDENGDKVIEEWDYSFDETINRIDYREYDANGYQVLHKKDLDNDGVIDSVTTTVNDEDGNEILWDKDRDNDGVPEQGSYSRYDIDGNLISIFNYDYLRPWRDTATYFQYTVVGDQRQIYSEKYKVATGLIDRVDMEYQSYDEMGNLTCRKVDNYYNEKINLVVTFYYDENGNQVRRDTDGDINEEDEVDGIADRILRTFYDQYGNKIRFEFDDNNDGFLEEVRHMPQMLL